MQDLQKEKYQTLSRDIKEDLSKWREIFMDNMI